MPRHLVWFSCGAASAVAAKLTVDSHPSTVEVLYCDTLAYEHPDNQRFLADVERWLGVHITLLSSPKYTDIFDVFSKKKYLVGVNGAPCTTALKRDVRKAYERPGDVHVFGFTVEEGDRIDRFDSENPNIQAEFPLFDTDISKQDCYRIIQDAGIELPTMYRLGYRNNNCIGCVKGGMGYWNKIRADFPEAFDRMAQLERKMNVSIIRREIPGTGRKKLRVFLDELEPDAGRYDNEDIECGVLCVRDTTERH